MESITYKDGRSYTITYLRVYLPAEFEPQHPRGQSRKGWFCPIGIRCTS